MGFSLFGSSGDGPKTETTTNATDASATAAEGSLAASGGSNITVNSVDSEITGQAFKSNTLIAGAALESGIESLRISAGLVPDFLKSQSESTNLVLKASQENANLAEQFASAGAASGRAAATGGASTLLEGPIPYIVGAIALFGLWFAFRKKS